MQHPQLDQILTELRQALEKLYGERLESVILYGSQARGDAEEYSDIDVLVVLHGAVDRMLERSRTSEVIASLSLQYHTVISRMILSSDDYQHEQDSFMQNVQRDGILV